MRVVSALPRACGWGSRAAGDTRTVLSGLQPLWVLPLALRAVRAGRQWAPLGHLCLGWRWGKAGLGKPGAKGRLPGSRHPHWCAGQRPDYEAWPVAGATWRLGQHGQPGQRGAKAGWLRRGCIRVRSAGLCGQEQCSLCPRGQPGRLGQRLVTDAWGWAERGPQVGGPSPEGLLSPPVARPGHPRTGDTPTGRLPESESRGAFWAHCRPGALEPSCSRESRQPHVQGEADAAQLWARRPQPRLPILYNRGCSSPRCGPHRWVWLCAGSWLRSRGDVDEV